MKLYHYDHCPYCVRVRTAAGLLGVPLLLHAMLNDDEDTPHRLVGRKIAPILQQDDGRAMPESLDIVAWLDRDSQRLGTTARPDVQALLDSLGRYSSRLLHPRLVQLPLPEFATASARAYYITKKTASIGDFAQALADTPQYLDALQHDLQQAAACMETFVGGQTWDINDVLLFPLLRNLSCVAGAIYPAAVRRYLDDMAQRTGVALYFDQAL